MCAHFTITKHFFENSDILNLTDLQWTATKKIVKKYIQPE